MDEERIESEVHSGHGESSNYFSAEADSLYCHEHASSSSFGTSKAPQHLELEKRETQAIIAEGIASAVRPLMTDFDACADGALKSQGVLRSSIDRLTRELDKLLEDAPLPFISQHASKLSGVRKRVQSLNSTLQIIQRRIDNIERILFRQENGARSGQGEAGMPHKSNQNV